MRTALVIDEKSKKILEKKKRNYAKKLKKMMKLDKISDNELFNEMREHTSEFKEDLGERLNVTKFKPVNLDLRFLENIKLKSNDKVIAKMQEYDPDFDIYELEDDAKLILINTFDLYFKNSWEYMASYCSE